MSTEHSAPEGDKAELATRTEGLVKRLRMAARHPYMNNTCPANIFDVAEAADEIERLELAVSDMHMSYNNCASNADTLRDQRDEARRENERLRGVVNDARLQLEYLNEKQERGSTNGVLAQTRAALPHP